MAYKGSGQGNAGLPDAPVSDLTVDPFQPGRLLAATGGYAGLYAYTIR